MPSFGQKPAREHPMHKPFEKTNMVIIHYQSNESGQDKHRWLSRLFVFIALSVYYSSAMATEYGIAFGRASKLASNFGVSGHALVKIWDELYHDILLELFVVFGEGALFTITLLLARKFRHIILDLTGGNLFWIAVAGILTTLCRWGTWLAIHQAGERVDNFLAIGLPILSALSIGWLLTVDRKNGGVHIPSI